MAAVVLPRAGADLRRQLADAFVWRTDRGEDRSYADLTGWWRDPAILAWLGAGLAGLYGDAAPTVVVGPQSRGVLLGSLTAVALGVGFVEARKNPAPAADSDAWVRRRTAPDYRDRQVLGEPWMDPGKGWNDLVGVQC